MRVLGLIPARGGSKGIPRKNLAPFAGKPLLLWTCEAALQATSLTKVVLSTEDGEIAAVGRKAGVDVPFVRPADLARDDTPTLAVAQDVLQRFEDQGEDYDAVCILQPTNPLRSAEDIEAAVALFEQREVDAVVSVAPIPKVHHPYWAYVQDDAGLLQRAAGGDLVTRRQDLPPAWYREGGIYLVRSAIVLEQDSLYGERCLPYVMPESRSGGIDTPEDLAALEQKFAAVEPA